MADQLTDPLRFTDRNPRCDDGLSSRLFFCWLSLFLLFLVGRPYMNYFSDVNVMMWLRMYMWQCSARTEYLWVKTRIGWLLRQIHLILVQLKCRLKKRRRIAHSLPILKHANDPKRRPKGVFSRLMDRCDPISLTIVIYFSASKKHAAATWHIVVSSSLMKIASLLKFNSEFSPKKLPKPNRKGSSSFPTILQG